MNAKPPSVAQDGHSLFIRKNAGTVLRTLYVSMVCRQRTGVQIKTVWSPTLFSHLSGGLPQGDMITVPPSSSVHAAEKRGL